MERKKNSVINLWLKIWISAIIFVPLTFVEGRLHLGKTQKIFDLFGFSLGLHYLCKKINYQSFTDSQKRKRDSHDRPKIFGRPTEDIGTDAQIVSAAREVLVFPYQTTSSPGRIHLVPRQFLPDWSACVHTFVPRGVNFCPPRYQLLFAAVPTSSVFPDTMTHESSHYLQ